MEQEMVTLKRMSKGVKQKAVIFSCLFHLSKNSLALGAGIPIAFFLFMLMSVIGIILYMLGMRVFQQKNWSRIVYGEVIERLGLFEK